MRVTACGDVVSAAKLRAMRAAALAAVNAFFDSMEEQERAPRVIHRPPATAGGAYNETDMAHANAIARKHGIG